MALNACDGCTTKFAVGLKRCPHCGSTDFHEDGDPMAKITRHGGASDATLAAEPEMREAPGTGEPMSAVDGDELTGDGSGHVLPPVDTEGGEDVSAGADTSTSSETPSEKPEPSETPAPSPARTTGSRSRKGRTGSASASSTGGGQETGMSETSSADK